MSATVEIVLRGLDDVTPTLRQVEKEATAAAKSIKSSFEDAGKAMSEVGGTLSKYVTAPLMAAGGAALHFSMDLNSAMSDVETLIPGATERVLELKAAVQEMAVDTGETTGDLASGLYQVISAFGDTADTVKILEANAKAATAGAASTTDAINLTSAVTKGFGDVSAEAVEHASDLAFMAVKMGQTTFPELAGSIGSVVPLAAELKVSQEELFGVFATLTGVTGGASEVATQFRGVLQALMAPTESMSTLIADMGFTSGQAMMEQLGLQGTIQAIAQAAQETGTQLQQFVGSIEGQTAVLALAGAQAGTFNEKLAAMGQAAGATEEAFRAKTEGVNAAGFAWQQLQQELAVTAQQLGDSLAPAFSAALDAAQPLFDAVRSGIAWFTSLDQGTQQVILTAVGLVAALGPLLMMLGAVASALSTLLSPIGLVVAAVAVLAGGIGFLWATNEEFRAGVIAAWTEIQAVLMEIWAVLGPALTDLWNSLIATAMYLFGALQAWWQEWGATILALAQGAWNQIKLTIETAIKLVQDIIGLVLAVIRNDWKEAWDRIKSIGQTVWHWIVGSVNNLASTLAALWDSIRDKVVGVWEGIKSVIKSAINAIISGINRFISAWNSIRLTIPEVDIPLVGKVGGFSIGLPRIPQIPMLAEGALVTDPTLAWIGEGADDEAVLPLGRLVPILAAALRQVLPGEAGGTVIERFYVDMRGAHFGDGRDAGRQLLGVLEQHGVRIQGV